MSKSPVKCELATYDLSKVARLFTCPLCGGYLVDAVAITECHHRFCKSCIYSYFFPDVFKRRQKASQLEYEAHLKRQQQDKDNKPSQSITTTVKSSAASSPPPSASSSSNHRVSSSLAAAIGIPYAKSPPSPSTNSHSVTTTTSIKASDESTRDLPPISPNYQPPSSNNSATTNSSTSSSKPTIVNTCPVCGIEAHKSMPWKALVPDQDWQNLLYLLIPHAFTKEQDNRRKFWASRGFNYNQRQSLNLTPASLQETKNKLKRSLTNDSNKNNFEFDMCEEILKQFPPVAFVREITCHDGEPAPVQTEDDCTIVTYNYSSKKSSNKAKEISMITTRDLVEWTWIQC